MAMAIVRVQEVDMARIIVTDLPQSEDLDREAMHAIAGGSRAATGPLETSQATLPANRILDYPPGFGELKRSAASAS
jgi:hypothetical protein